MNTQLMIELFGYLGSFLVLISFLMTSVFKLRIVNTIGSVIFMIYAFIIHSYPTAIMNFCLVLINLYYLWKLSHAEKTYDFIEVEDEEPFLRYTLNRYQEDIQKCFPGIQIDHDAINRSFVVSHEGKPVGITLGVQKDDELELILDYSIPEYRDFSIGSFLLTNLKQKGIKKLVYRGPIENHIEYLNKLGFMKKEDYFEKVL